MNTLPNNTVAPAAIESNRIKMEVCDYRMNINHNNNQSPNMTAPVQSQTNTMAVLQRNTVSSASSLDSSASYGYPLRQSPLHEQPQGISKGISQGVLQAMPAPAPGSITAPQAMTSMAAPSAIPSTHNNTQTPITMPMTTPLSLIDSLKMKFPLAASMGATGGVTQFSDINGIPPVNPFSEETDSPIVGNTNVPEFLYQLIKMLTDNHREVIEWSNGKLMSFH